MNIESNQEFEALCARLLPKFNEYLRLHSKNIFSCELATSLDGIKTMPALYDLNGVRKQVIAPLSLLTKDVDAEIAEAKKATAAAKANDPQAKTNKEEGEKYLAEKVKEGYTKTESGIAYKVITEGKGENFTADQRIDIRYEGKLINGTVFDATQGDEVRPMSPNQVVPGFKEALLLMKPGMKIEVIIPGDLAYGVDGRGGLIGPNATLIFTIEAVGVHADK